MVFRKPYIPGYALEVDMLVLLWTAVVFAWFRWARRHPDQCGARSLAAWWGAEWLLEVWRAIAPWVLPMDPLSLPELAGTSLLQGLACTGAVGAFLDCLPEAALGRRARRLLLGGLLLGLSVAACFAPAKTFEILAACCFLARALRRRATAGTGSVFLLAVLSIVLVFTGRILVDNWQHAQWVGLLSASSMRRWTVFIATLAVGIGGWLWWLAERRWQARTFPVAKPGAILAIGTFAFFILALGDRHLRQRLADDLHSRMAEMATRFSPADILTLQKGAEPVDGPVHRRVWKILRTISGPHSSCYLMSLRGTEWYFPIVETRTWERALKESELDYRPWNESDNWVLPTNRPAFLPPFQDAWGVLVTAAIPLREDGPAGRTLFCIDYPALAWTGELLALRLPSLGLLLAAGACGALWLAVLRRRAEVEASTTVVAAVNHELRTPLQSLIGYADLLARTTLADGQRTAVGRIQSEARQLSHLIRQMLDLSALETGSFTLHEKHESPGAIAREALAAVEPGARRKNLALHLELDPLLPPAVLIDGVRLRQILANFLSNAVRYTPHGTVRLHATVDAAGRLVFAVTDTGIGLSDAERARLFRPFKRGRHAARLAHDGTGLGLAITRQLVDRMGGVIEVESRPGQGSTFRARLPFVAVAPETVPVTATELPRLGGRTVLLVEDHPAVAELLSTYVESLDGRVAAATTLADARSWLNANGAPEFVVADAGLPDGDGFSLRSEAPLRDAPHCWTVAISANDNLATRERAERLGWPSLLAKPCELDEFAAAFADCPWLRTPPTPPVPPAKSSVREQLIAQAKAELHAAVPELTGLVDATDPLAMRKRAHYLANSATCFGPAYAGVLKCLQALEQPGQSPAELRAHCVSLASELTRLATRTPPTQ